MAATSKAVGRHLLPLASLAVFALALVRSGAQAGPGGDPHASGNIVAPAGTDEVKFCTKCHTAGCPMPHPERVPVSWQTNARIDLRNGLVTCGSCHTQGFKHRGDAFLARDQKGLCSPCHFAQHVLPDAHPFGTPCESCHAVPKTQLLAGSAASGKMVSSIDGECLRCHYDGPISHPVGMPNSKKPAADLPLSQDGKITCITCHVAHSNQNTFGQLLRKSNRRGALCLSCHDDL